MALTLVGTGLYWFSHSTLLCDLVHVPEDCREQVPSMALVLPAKAGNQQSYKLLMPLTVPTQVSWTYPEPMRQTVFQMGLVGGK